MVLLLTSFVHSDDDNDMVLSPMLLPTTLMIPSRGTSSDSRQKKLNDKTSTAGRYDKRCCNKNVTIRLKILVSIVLLVFLIQIPTSIQYTPKTTTWSRMDREYGERLLTSSSKFNRNQLSLQLSSTKEPFFAQAASSSSSSYSKSSGSSLLPPSSRSNRPVVEHGIWQAFYDTGRTGLVYYYNTQTGVTQWHRPYPTFPPVMLNDKQRQTVQFVKEQIVQTQQQTNVGAKTTVKMDDETKKKQSWFDYVVNIIMPANDNKIGSIEIVQETKPIVTIPSFPKMDMHREATATSIPLFFSTANKEVLDTKTDNDKNPPLAREGYWEAYFDSEQDEVYYYNTKSGTSQWEIPTLTFPVVINIPQKKSAVTKDIKQGVQEQSNQQRVDDQGDQNNLLLNVGKWIFDTSKSSVISAVNSWKESSAAAEKEQQAKQADEKIPTIQSNSWLDFIGTWFQKSVEPVDDRSRDAPIVDTTGKKQPRNYDAPLVQSSSQEQAEQSWSIPKAPSLSMIQEWTSMIVPQPRSKTFSISALLNTDAHNNPHNSIYDDTNVDKIMNTDRGTGNNNNHNPNTYKTYEVRRIPTFSITALEREKKKQRKNKTLLPSFSSHFHDHTNKGLFMFNND